MGARRHGQEGALAPLWKCCNVFCTLQNAQQTNYLCIIFTTCRRLLEPSSPDPYRGSIPESPLGDFRPQTPNLPTHRKSPAGVHAIPCAPVTYSPGGIFYVHDQQFTELSLQVFFGQLASRLVAA